LDTLENRSTYPLKDWINPNSATADYYHRNTTQPNQIPYNGNLWEYQQPHSGNAFAGIIPYQFLDLGDNRTRDVYREYIQCKLKHPLLQGKQYCLSFYINPSSYTVLDGFNRILSDDIHAAITTDRLTRFTVPDASVRPVDCRVRAEDYLPIGRGVFRSDTSQWYPLQINYVAKGGEEWLTIGNFEDNFHTNTIMWHPSPATTDEIAKNSYISYIYIDDVSLTELPPVLNTIRDSTICTFPVPLQAAAGFTNYLWNTGETTQSIIAPQAGDYWVKVTMDECGSVTDTITLRPFVPSVLSLADATICADALPVSVTANSGFSAYLWSDGSTTQSLNLSQSGSYTLTATHQCGTVTDNMAVNILPRVPAFSLGTSPIDICEDGKQTPITLRPDQILPNYQWNTGATTSSIAVAEAGIYSLVSENDCNTERAEIEVIGCPATLYFPNAFSPNNDGYNDVYLPFGKNVTFLSLQIFDRWGELVYEEKGNDLHGWDGSFRGKPLDTGVFVYLCRYQSDVSDKIEIAKGDISLIK
jgi:gliding motility-associated-like protein